MADVSTDHNISSDYEKFFQDATLKLGFNFENTLKAESESQIRGNTADDVIVMNLIVNLSEMFVDPVFANVCRLFGFEYSNAFRSAMKYTIISILQEYRNTIVFLFTTKILHLALVCLICLIGLIFLFVCGFFRGLLLRAPQGRSS